MSILQELYLGNLSPVDKCFVGDDLYGSLIDIIVKNEKALYNR